MLTPDDMQKKIFALGRRLENNDVGIFVKEVQINYQFLYDQVEEQKKQIKGMENKLTHYRKIESSLQEALVSAERVSESKIHDAEKKSRQIEKTAYRKADEILDDAKRELEHIKGLIGDFESEYKAYQDKYYDFVQGQLSFIEEAKKFVLEEKMEFDEYKSREEDDLFNDKELSSSVKFEDVVANNGSNKTEEVKNIPVEDNIKPQELKHNKAMEKSTDEKVEPKEEPHVESSDNDESLNYEDLNKVNDQSAEIGYDDLNEVDDRRAEMNYDNLGKEDNHREELSYGDLNEQDNQNKEASYDDLSADTDNGATSQFDEPSIDSIGDNKVKENGVDGEILDSKNVTDVQDNAILNNFEEEEPAEDSTMFGNDDDLLSQGIVDDQKMPEDENYNMPNNIPNFDEVPEFNMPDSVDTSDMSMDYTAEQDLGQKEPEEFNPDDVFTLPDIDLDFPDFNADENEVSDTSKGMGDMDNTEPVPQKEADLSMNSNIELKYANDSFLSGLKKKKSENESILASLNLSSNKDDSRDRIKNLERSYTKDLLESNKALLNSGNIEKADDGPSLPKKEDIGNRRSMFAMQSDRK